MFTKWWTVKFPHLSTKKRMSISFLLLAFAIALSGCALLPNEAVEEDIPTITPPKISQKPEYAVTTDTIETKVSGIGKIMAKKEESLFFADSNQSSQKRVIEIYVSVGDHVTEGQVIAETDVKDLVDQLRQKELQFKSDELQMKQTLRNRDQLSDAEFEQAKISFEMKRQELVKLQEDIEYAKLKAPFDGTIVSLSMSKGASVQAYSEVGIIADLTELAIAAKLSTNDLKNVAPGMETNVNINVAGSFQGTVSQLPVPKDNQQNNGGYYGGQQQQKDSIQDYLLVHVDPFPKDVTRGTPLSAEVIVSRKEHAVVIPPSTLRTYGGRTYVQVVEEDGTKREVDVEVGIQTSTQVEIVKGLQPGQKVVGR